DSFYAGSRFEDVDVILKKAEQMLNDGATILDIGGQSTKPGSEPLSADKERKRVITSVETIHQRFPETFISIDTYYSAVAKDAIDAGADIINDISAAGVDNNIIHTAALLKTPYILMHMKGTPQTMQQNPEYENVTKEVLDFFIQKISQLHQSGLNDVIIDPGFGFGKTIAHNFELLRNLEVFKMLNTPVLAGISRKSSIYKTLGITADEALNGTTVLNTIALMNGANILRVHDVKEAMEAVKLFNAYLKK
ncbi:MAG TPA: dihydropteroate synthase, partial [Chitinophagaceae bacterium]|nr:dihydropteroate synthase [Chitinophagaceae bacterium]